MQEPEFQIGDRVMGATGINSSYVDAIIEGTVAEIEILGDIDRIYVYTIDGVTSNKDYNMLWKRRTAYECNLQIFDQRIYNEAMESYNRYEQLKEQIRELEIQANVSKIIAIQKVTTTTFRL